MLTNNLFRHRGTNYRLTAKRLGALALALGIYLPAEALIWSGMMLDELLFPSYRSVKLPPPVFIIGNPRSGTTLLQRLLARDKENFLSMLTWEIFGSPSISTRKLLWGITDLGRSVGVSIQKRILRMEQLWKDSDPIHRLRIQAPEEDEYLFIHNFFTLKIWSFASMEEEAEPFIYYDQLVPEEKKQRQMAFYKRCLQRHFFAHGNQARFYLSKNPNFSPAIGTLLEFFPEARFIYLIRNPLEAVPSHISLKDREWRLLGSPLSKYACRDFIIKSSLHWYNYPLEKLRELPENRVAVIRFDDLVADVGDTVKGLYNQFELDLSSEFELLLEQETERARNHQSRHIYNLEEMGLSRDELAQTFRAVMDRYGFQA